MGSPSTPSGSFPQPGDRLLTSWLALLSLLAGGAVVQALLLPSWPRVAEPPQAAVQRALALEGLQPQPLPSRPARRSQERGLSRQLGWSLAGGAQLWIATGSVRRYEDLQTAFLSRQNADLQLLQRRLNHPWPGSASGSIQRHPSIQTCLVPQRDAPALAGVTRNELLFASDPRRQLQGRRDPASLASSLWALVKPRDFACVLVTLRGASDQPLPAQLWRRLLPTLQSALIIPSRQGSMASQASP